jgi:hypothetical protein
MKPDQNKPVDDSSPGLPGFRTWAGVYWFVFGAFVALVTALAIFSRLYS